MPASKKTIKNQEKAANRAAGIGDENGRLPSRVKAAEVNANCTQCMMPIRMTKTNTEARAHAESKHPSFTFAACFPGQFDPTIPVVSTQSNDTTTVTAPVVVKKVVKKTEDLSFLDAALLPTSNKKK